MPPMSCGPFMLSLLGGPGDAPVLSILADWRSARNTWSDSQSLERRECPHRVTPRVGRSSHATIARLIPSRPSATETLSMAMQAKVQPLILPRYSYRDADH